MTSDDDRPAGQTTPEPAIVSKARAIRAVDHLEDDEKKANTLLTIVRWLDDRRAIDEGGVDIWQDGLYDRVVAERSRRLLRMTGHYSPTESPVEKEISASDFFHLPQASLVDVVRRLRIALPETAPQDVTEGLAALERFFSAQDL
jgi:hypothetical protein